MCQANPGQSGQSCGS